MNHAEFRQMIAEEREATAKATAKVLYEERTFILSQAVKEREEHAKTREALADMRKRSDADRKRLRSVEHRLAKLEGKAAIAEQMAPLKAETAALTARIAELETARDRPSLPKPEPRAAEIAEMREHRAKKEANNG